MFALSGALTYWISAVERRYLLETGDYRRCLTPKGEDLGVQKCAGAPVLDRPPAIGVLVKRANGMQPIFLARSGGLVLSPELENPPTIPILPCEICGFVRLTEQAHLVARRLGGPDTSDNLVSLCPNHHSLLDRDLLRWPEMEKIWRKLESMLRLQWSDPRVACWYQKLTEMYGLATADEKEYSASERGQLVPVLD